MLFFSAFPNANGFSTYDEGLAAIRQEPAAASELGAVVDLVFDETRHDALALTGALAHVPLRVHASYQREEILAALDYANLQRKPVSMMQGVAYSDALNVDAFPRHPEEVRGRLLTHHDVSRLPHQPHALPLGVAERHLA